VTFSSRAYEETIDPSLSLEGHRGDETNRRLDGPRKHRNGGGFHKEKIFHAPPQMNGID